MNELKSRRAWLKEYRIVKQHSKRVETREWIDRKRTINGDLIEHRIPYGVYSKDQTKKVQCPEKRRCIDYFCKFLASANANDKIKTKTEKGICVWRHDSNGLTWQNINRHMFKPKKGDIGRFGICCDKYSPHNLLYAIRLDFDNKAKTEEEFIAKLQEIKEEYSAIGTVIFNNIVDHNCKGFHVLIILRRPMKQSDAVAWCLAAKEQNDWLDVYYPNSHNQGIRLEFDHDRKFIDSSGNLVSNKNWKQIWRTLESGSNLSKLNKIVKKLNLNLKRETVVVKSKQKKERTGSYFRGRLLPEYKKMYEIDDHDFECKAGSINIFAFKWNSGAIKACILRGDTNAEIMHHIGNSLYVQRRFSDVDNWKKIIDDCRVEVDNENDAMNKVWHSNRPYAEDLIHFWLTGEYRRTSVKTQIIDVMPNEQAVKQLAEHLSQFDFFSGLDVNGYARWILIVCNRDRSSRAMNIDLLRQFGLKHDNNWNCALLQWLRENDYYDFHTSRAHGVATSYRATEKLKEIIKLRDVVAAVDCEEAAALVAAIDAGDNDMIFVSYVRLLHKLRNIPEFLLTDAEKICLVELSFVKYAATG